MTKTESRRRAGAAVRASHASLLASRPNREKALLALARMSGVGRPTLGTEIELTLCGSIGEYAQGRGIFADQVEAVLRNSPNVLKIQVALDSLGGSLNEGKRLYDLLSNHPAFVVCSVSGVAASAATLILLAADFRECAPHSRFLVHEPEVDPRTAKAARPALRWTAARHRLAAVSLERSTEALIQLMSSRLNLRPERIKRALQKDDFLSATAAIELGLCHGLAANTIWRAGRPYC